MASETPAFAGSRLVPGLGECWARIPWEFIALSIIALLSRDFVGQFGGALCILLAVLVIAYRRHGKARAEASQRSSAQRCRLDKLNSQLAERERKARQLAAAVAEMEQLCSEAQEALSMQRAQAADESARCRLAEARAQGERSRNQAVLAERLKEKRAHRDALVAQLKEERRQAKEFARQVKTEREQAAALVERIAEYTQRSERQEERIRKESERCAALLSQLREVEGESSRAQDSMAALAEQVERLRAKIGEHPVAQMAGWFGFTAGVSAQSLPALQGAPEPVQACHEGVAREAVKRAVNRSSQLSAQLNALETHTASVQRQREDLQFRCEELQRKSEDLCDDIREQEGLVERRRRELADTQQTLEEERCKSEALRLELRRLEGQRPNDPVARVGLLLQDTIEEAPPERRATVKAKLLNCFQPGKNPAADVASSITAMLQSMG